MAHTKIPQSSAAARSSQSKAGPGGVDPGTRAADAQKPKRKAAVEAREKIKDLTAPRALVTLDLKTDITPEKRGREAIGTDSGVVNKEAVFLGSISKIGDVPPPSPGDPPFSPMSALSLFFPALFRPLILIDFLHPVYELFFPCDISLVLLLPTIVSSLALLVVSLRHPSNELASRKLFSA
ncbi:hypothetical protein HDU93_007816 [Gonapodya sp. JEL0774]|nr:hypothetical protein HDU93_007816 [Gonapodya sp. JEL0774]